jgi:hypothetical protein
VRHPPLNLFPHSSSALYPFLPHSSVMAFPNRLSGSQQKSQRHDERQVRTSTKPRKRTSAASSSDEEEYHRKKKKHRQSQKQRHQVQQVQQVMQSPIPQPQQGGFFIPQNTFPNQPLLPNGPSFYPFSPFSVISLISLLM